MRCRSYLDLVFVKIFKSWWLVYTQIGHSDLHGQFRLDGTENGLVLRYHDGGQWAIRRRYVSVLHISFLKNANLDGKRLSSLALFHHKIGPTFFLKKVVICLWGLSARSSMKEDC